MRHHVAAGGGASYAACASECSSSLAAHALRAGAAAVRRRQPAYACMPLIAAAACRLPDRPAAWTRTWSVALHIHAAPSSRALPQCPEKQHQCCSALHAHEAHGNQCCSALHPHCNASFFLPGTPTDSTALRTLLVAACLSSPCAHSAHRGNATAPLSLVVRDPSTPRPALLAGCVRWARRPASCVCHAPIRALRPSGHAACCRQAGVCWSRVRATPAWRTNNIKQGSHTCHLIPFHPQNCAALLLDCSVLPKILATHTYNTHAHTLHRCSHKNKRTRGSSDSSRRLASDSAPLCAARHAALAAGQCANCQILAAADTQAHIEHTRTYIDTRALGNMHTRQSQSMTVTHTTEVLHTRRTKFDRWR